MRKFWALVLLLLFAFTAGWGKESEAVKTFREANQLYDGQNYNGAAQLYEKLMEEGVRTPALYYNLASAYFKSKETGKSILYLLRARRLSPGDEDVEGNLRFVSQFTLDKGNLSSPPLAFYTDRLTLGQWAFWGSTVYFLLVGLICGRIWFKSRALFIRSGIWLCGILFFFFACGFYLRWNWEKVPQGVILAREAAVKSGPGEDFVTQLLGHEGLTFQILEERQDYYEVLLPNGVKGWVKKEEAAKV